MELIKKYPQHEKIIQLGYQCIWCWQCFKLAKVYCDTKELENWHGIDNMLVVIIKEYAYLQAAKLHDNISIGKYKNHTIEFVIRQIPNNKMLLHLFDQFIAGNAAFIAPLKLARSQLIAHYDIFAIKNQGIIGNFPEDAEKTYFDSLKHLLDQIYEHVEMGCFPDWPDFSENDAEEFIKILINHKNDYRKKDSRHISS
jgi:hypothetical protein